MGVATLKVDNSFIFEKIRCFKINLIDIGLEEVQPYLNRLGGVNIIITTNISHIASLDRGEMRDATCYYNADLILCDSRVLKDICFIIGKRINNVVPGSDLTKYLFENILTSTDKVMVLGSTCKDIEVLKAKYNLPNLSYYSPPFGFIENQNEIEKIITIVNKAKPRYLFLALGALRQEILACILKPQLHHRCDLYCIGASIDFLTGAQKRAPNIFQTLHMEWLYRLASNPRRLFRRYLLDMGRIIHILFRNILLDKSKRGVK